MACHTMGVGGAPEAFASPCKGAAQACFCERVAAALLLHSTHRKKQSDIHHNTSEYIIKLICRVGMNCRRHFITIYAFFLRIS
jgi:hypothetical protein